MCPNHYVRAHTGSSENMRINPYLTKNMKRQMKAFYYFSLYFTMYKLYDKISNIRNGSHVFLIISHK